MVAIRRPSIIQFPRIGKISLGYISFSEKDNLPFIVKRVYWTYFTPDEIQRGGHSHLELEQILIAAAGCITIKTEMNDGYKQTFILNSPEFGLLIPKRCWREMKYSHDAVQICIASKVYDESDYIRSYEEFKMLRQAHK